MKRTAWTAILGLVLLAAAYVAGFWPEHRRRTGLEERLAATERQLDAARAQVRLGDVLGQLLRLSDAVAQRNYGQAAMLSSVYFDHVREEASRAASPTVREALEQILRSRDQVTAALARSDPSIASTLHDQAIALRSALGYPVEAAQPNELPRK